MVTLQGRVGQSLVESQGIGAAWIHDSIDSECRRHFAQGRGGALDFGRKEEAGGCSRCGTEGSDCGKKERGPSSTTYHDLGRIFQASLPKLNEPFCVLNRQRELTLPRPTVASAATRSAYI